jgi:hypothetical protein
LKIAVFPSTHNSDTTHCRGKRNDAARRYNGTVANIPKVPRAEFEAVIKALLRTPPMPANAITDKRPRSADAKRPGPKKRG